MEPQIDFFAISTERKSYDYVIIPAQYKDKWLWVRQHSKTTWELPGGHVEPDELVDKACERELIEETGALKFRIIPVCDFSIRIKERMSYNRLALAFISSIGPLPESEIAEVSSFDTPPDELTHGLIQPLLLDRVNMFLLNNCQSQGE